MKQPHSTTAETSAARRELAGLVALLHDLAEDGFYGELSITYNGGRPRHIRKEVSLLPSQLRNRATAPAFQPEDLDPNATEHATTG